MNFRQSRLHKEENYKDKGHSKGKSVNSPRRHINLYHVCT